MGQVSDAVRHALLFNTNPRYQRFLTNPAVADYTTQKLLDYAATLDKYQTPNNICSVGQVAAVRAQEKEEESAVGVMKELADGIMKMLAEKSPKNEKRQEYREAEEGRGDNRRGYQDGYGYRGGNRRYGPPNYRCFYCDKPGHRRDECEQRKADLRLRRETNEAMRRRKERYYHGPSKQAPKKVNEVNGFDSSEEEYDSDWPNFVRTIQLVEDSDEEGDWTPTVRRRRFD